MGKLSQLDSDRQMIERLRDVVPPPSFDQTARAARIVPPPPKPTTIEKGGLPHHGSGIFLICVVAVFAAIAALSFAVLRVR